MREEASGDYIADKSGKFVHQHTSSHADTLMVTMIMKYMLFSQAQVQEAFSTEALTLRRIIPPAAL